MAKDKASKRAPETGIVFPLEPTAKPGKELARGSTYGNQAALAAALGAVDAAEAEKCLKKKNWRDNYGKFLVKHVELGVTRGHEEVSCERVFRVFSY